MRLFRKNLSLLIVTNSFAEPKRKDVLSHCDSKRAGDFRSFHPTMSGILPDISKGFYMIYSTQNGVSFGPFGTDAAQRIMAKQGATKLISISKLTSVAPYVVTFDTGDTLTVESGARVAGGEMAGAMLNGVYNIALWANVVLGENKRRQLAADLAVNEGLN